MRSAAPSARAAVIVAAACLCGAAQAPGTLPRTELPLLLTGVMVDSAGSARSACLIRCLSPSTRKSASMLQAGDTACDLAEVTQIRPDAVVLRNLQSDRLELLPLPDAGAPAARRSDAGEGALEPIVVNEARGVVSVDVSKTAVDQHLMNLSDLLASAQAVPRVRAAPGGRQVIDGFELRQIRAGSVVEKVGLRDGDVLLEVNGVPLDGLPAVLRLFGQAQAAGQATLTVLRGSERMTFNLRTR